MIDGEALWNKKMTDGLEDFVGVNGEHLRCYGNIPSDLYTALENTAKKHPKKCAIIDDDYTEHTYESFYVDVRLLSQAFLNNGIKKGDYVVILLNTSYEYCLSFFALINIGAIILPVSTKLAEREMYALIDTVEVRTIICEENFKDYFKDKNEINRILVDREHIGLQRFMFPQATRNNSCEVGSVETSNDKKNDPSILMFTSGTTAKSKGVLLRNYNIMQSVESYRRILDIDSNSISLIGTPIYHVTGLIALLGLFIYSGGTLLLHRFFNVERYVKDLRDFNIDFVHASPTVFNLLIKQLKSVDYLDQIKVTSFACGSSNMPKEKILELHELLPKAKFHTIFGLTETSSPATVFPDDAATSEYIGSSGFPIPVTKFKIIDENGDELENGSIGEVCVYGSVVLSEYLNYDGDALQNGWLRTGDLGYFNNCGYLYIVDRKKNMINRGGEKVWSYDVENIISEIDGVDDVAVVGIKDDFYGEIPVAMAVRSSDKINEETLKTILKKKLAKYEIPVHIHFVDELPLTVNGKVNKVRIKQILEEKYL